MITKGQKCKLHRVVMYTGGERKNEKHLSVKFSVLNLLGKPFYYLEDDLFFSRNLEFLLPSMMTQEIDLYLTDRRDVAHSAEYKRYRDPIFHQLHLATA